MKEKKNTQNFEIKCLDTNKNVFNAIITVWVENHTDPKIYDIVNNEEYSFKGKHDIFFLQYKDEFGTTIENYSWKLSNSFYGMRVKAEAKGIKMLIKGSSLKYFMIPRLQFSIKAMQLTLGRPQEKNTPKVIIFDPENCIDNIASVGEQVKFYYEWVESITNISYDE